MRAELAIRAKDFNKEVQGVKVVDYRLSSLDINYLTNQNTIIFNNISDFELELIENSLKLENVTYKKRIGEFTSILRYKCKKTDNIHHVLN